MSKCIILSRVSSAIQDLTDQTNDLLREAKRLGYSDNDIITIEDVESATKLSEEERQGLNKLKHHINSDSSIDCVICWEPSRISRQQKILYSIRDFLIDKHIQLIILNPYTRLLDSKGKLDQTASIVFSLFSTLAENEMMIKKERFARAKKAMQAQGKLTSGKPLFGYVVDKDKYISEDKEEADTVRYIFTAYANGGVSLRTLYNKLLEDGTMAASNTLAGINKIKFIIGNLTYSGRGTSKAAYPAIVTPELQDKAIEMLSKNKNSPKSKSKNIYYGKGLVKCGNCGYGMMPYSSGKGYRCFSEHYGRTHDGHSNMVNVNVLDSILWDTTRVIANIDAGIEDAKMIVEYNKRIEENKNAIDNIRRMVKDLEDKERKAFNLYIDGKVSQSIYDERMESIHKDKEHWQSEITKKHQQIYEYEQFVNSSSDFNKSFRNLDSIEDDEARQEIVHKYIDEVIVTKLSEGNIGGSYKAKIEIVPKTALIVPQKNEYFIYEIRGAYKRLERHNDDGTVDDITNTIIQIHK